MEIVTVFIESIYLISGKPKIVHLTMNQQTVISKIKVLILSSGTFDF